MVNIFEYLLKNLILTEIIEILGIFIIKINNKKNLFNIIVVNIITNLPFSLLSYLIVYYNLKINYYLFIIISEIIIILIETYLFNKYLIFKNKNIKKTICLSIYLNMLSFVIGNLLLFIIKQ